MDPLLSTLALILLALLGARFTFSTEAIPPGPRLLFRTGTHFLVLGILIGPNVLGLVGEQALTALYPLLALGIGWIGFLFGLQLDRSHLREFPRGFLVVALGQAVLTLLVFYGVGRVALELTGFGDRVSHLMLWAAAATACISTPAGVAMVSANFLVRGNVRQLLFYVASVDALVGIATLELVLAHFRPGDLVQGVGGGVGVGGGGGVEWVVAAVGLGVVTGVILLWLTRHRPTRDELVLYLLGTAALASGTAFRLELSPLFVTVTAGAIVANLSPDRQRVFVALHKWEKPVYVVVLILAGALIGYPTHWILPLAALYVAVRILGKGLGGAVMARAVPLPFRPPTRLGFGLVPQGGISLAMAVSWILLYPDLHIGSVDASALLFDVIVLGVVVSELVGPSLTIGILREAGEIAPGVERAIGEGDEDRAREEAIRHQPPEPQG